jgi:hypothetical protein
MRISLDRQSRALVSVSAFAAMFVSDPIIPAFFFIGPQRPWLLVVVHDAGNASPESVQPCQAGANPLLYGALRRFTDATTGYWG